MSRTVQKRALDATLVALVGLFVWLGVTRAAADERFRLPEVVPNDVFVYAGGHYNPELDFVHERWADVMAEFEKSGIVGDLIKLIQSQMSEAQRAEFDRVHARFGKLCAAVDWDNLGGGEIAFAERMRSAELRGTQVNIAMPDIVVLMRLENGDPAETFANLCAMLDAGVEEIGKLAQVELTVERVERGDMRFAIFDATQATDDGPSLPLSIGHYRDVILFGLGRDLRNDVADLLQGQRGEIALPTLPRYQETMKRLPAPEDGFVYFDMPNLRGQFESIILPLLAETSGDEIVNAEGSPELNRMINESIAASQAGDTKKALEITQEAHKLAPTNSIVLYNLACFHALSGEKEVALDWLTKAVAGGFRDAGQIAGDADLETLRDDPRYAAALAAARNGGDGDDNSEKAHARRVIARLLETAGAISTGAEVYTTEGAATHSIGVTVLADDVRDNPIYPVLVGHDPVADWARYLPVETTDFSVGSGISLPALYTYIEDSFHEAGPGGDEVWTQWESFQKEQGFDMHDDLLDWLDTACVSTNFKLDGQDAWALLLKVRNESVAREKVALATQFMAEKLDELAAEIPPLAMLSMQVEPTMSDSLEGFLDIRMAMLPEPIVCGVRDGWIMLGSSEQAMLTVLATAAGDHANVTQNPFVARRVAKADGPVQAISFTDHRGDAEEFAAVLSGMAGAGGMVMAMIPEPEVREMIAPIFGMIAKLGPVVAKMNFFEASSMETEFDGQVYLTRKVTHYVPPAAN